MNQKAGSRGQTMNVLFTMLLFLVFVLCALFTVLIGGKVYENISARMEENYLGSTALSYVANKVRQGDVYDMISVEEIEGVPVLQIGERAGEETYITWIYQQDGYIKELYTDIQSGLTLKDGLEIMECEGLSLSMNQNLLRIEILGQDGGTLLLSVRSSQNPGEGTDYE